MDQKLRWGLLGAGHISREFARDLPFARTGELAAIGSRSLAGAERFAAEFPGCRAHGSYATLLADPAIDAVYIGTPHPLHAELTVAAVRAGKHVLCEKPFAMNAAEAEGVFREAERSGCFVMEAFKDRCLPLLDAVIAALPRLGTLGVIETSFGFAVPFDPASRLFAPELGGGAILDVGGYAMEMARRLAGAAAGRTFLEPETLRGVVNRSPVTGTDVTATALLRFPGGVQAILGCSVVTRLANQIRLNGDAGALIWPDPWLRARAGRLEARLVRPDGSAETITAETDRPIFALEADVAGEAIAAGHREADAMSWADTLGNMRALDAWQACDAD